MAERDNGEYQDQPSGLDRWLSPEYAKRGFFVGVGVALASDAYALISTIYKYGPPKQEELPLFITILGLQTVNIIGVSFLVSSFRPFSERIASNLTVYRLLIGNSINSIRDRLYRN